MGKNEQHVLEDDVILLSNQLVEVGVQLYILVQRRIKLVELRM